MKDTTKIALILVEIIIIILLIIGINKLKTGDTEEKEQLIRQEDGTVNKPILLEGMQPITFEEGKEKPTILQNNDAIEGKWYDYKAQTNTTEEGGTSKWANAITEDGSMWVWIPRYAYKIDWNKEQPTGKIDIMFLSGNTNENMEGQDVTKLGYIVHPAFQNGRKTGYANGEWDKEITGIWVAKFEAAFPGIENTASENIPIKESSIKYTLDQKNAIGEMTAGDTKIPYPAFVGKAYSYNLLTIGEMYNLSLALSEENNPYGIDKSVNSHMMKNSEWGAVTYLAHSKYGRNGTKVTINNMDVAKAMKGAVTITGYAGSTINALKCEVDNIDEMLKDNYKDEAFAWYTEKGKLASTTGNLYGIYDMNGASSEYVSGYIENIDEGMSGFYGEPLLRNKTSNKYCTIFKNTENGDLREKFKANQSKFGDATIETSMDGIGYTSWFEENSTYIHETAGFFLRSGSYDSLKYSGIFNYTNHSGHAFFSYGFRRVLI